MEFNIALNTIVYLMIFLFPGVIFRKFLFIREYSKEFDKGNLFERFIWTILTSIAILITTFSIFLFLKNILQLDLLPSISYKTIWNTFNDLSNNKLPNPNKKLPVKDKDVYRKMSLELKKFIKKNKISIVEILLYKRFNANYLLSLPVRKKIYYILYFSRQEKLLRKLV